MADPVRSSCRVELLWIAITALLAMLALGWVSGPAGDCDVIVDGPIASEERFGVKRDAIDLED